MCHFSQVTIALSGSDNPPVDMNAVTEMQAVSALVRTVQNTLADMKRKILKMENEINPFDADVW